MEDNFDMSKGAMKFDGGKPRMDLIPHDALFDIASVFTFGAVKYDSWNWCKGMRWGRCLAACIRHIYQFLGGDDNDKESGLPHLAHAGACIMMALSMLKRGLGEDDRCCNQKQPEEKQEQSPLSAEDYERATISLDLDCRPVNRLTNCNGKCFECDIKDVCGNANKTS